MMRTASRKISIKKGRDWQLRRGHPWLFSGAISQAPSGTTAGDIVEIVDVDGKFVARGFYNAACDIAVRVLTLDSEEEIDADFVHRRVASAVQLRDLIFDPILTNVFRLINAEGDGLPGIIVDVFSEVIVIQSHTAGSDRLLTHLVEALQKALAPKTIIVRNDAVVRKREGLELSAPQVVFGMPLEPDQLVQVRENGLTFCVDVIKGQKTGFFTDQRDRRAMVRDYVARMPHCSTLANCFSYSAGFSVYAAASNPQMITVNVDESAHAIELARKNYAINKIFEDHHQFVTEDAFSWLTRQRDEGRKFEIVILDPPAFAKSQKDKSSALKAYSRINQLGISCCTPGALLLTCSCSGVIDMSEFEECVREAAARAGRRIQLLESHRNSFDHPVNLMAPESQYLKTLLCRVI